MPWHDAEVFEVVRTHKKFLGILMLVLAVGNGFLAWMHDFDSPIRLVFAAIFGILGVLMTFSTVGEK